MFDLFKKGTQQVVSVAEKPKEKTTKEIIEEIHETFYTEVDRLLEEAGISHSMETTKQGLIDKSNRLAALGFNATKEVKEAKEEKDRLREIEFQNKEKASLIEAVNYFSFHYPQYKFITEESVKKICNKYNLIYGPADKYIGTVPDKNLEQIESFKIKEKDLLYIEKEVYRGDIVRFKYIHYHEYIEFHNKKVGTQGISFFQTRVAESCPIEIAAPIKDFDTKNMDVKDFKLSKIIIPDPVVLQPVLYKHKKYYLIITAWGDEASDELVVNERNN